MLLYSVAQVSKNNDLVYWQIIMRMVVIIIISFFFFGKAIWELSYAYKNDFEKIRENNRKRRKTFTIFTFVGESLAF